MRRKLFDFPMDKSCNGWSGEIEHLCEDSDNNLHLDEEVNTNNVVNIAANKVRPMSFLESRAISTNATEDRIESFTPTVLRLMNASAAGEDYPCRKRFRQFSPPPDAEEDFQPSSFRRVHKNGGGLSADSCNDIAKGVRHIEDNLSIYLDCCNLPNMSRKVQMEEYKRHKEVFESSDRMKAFRANWQKAMDAVQAQGAAAAVVLNQPGDSNTVEAVGTVVANGDTAADELAEVNSIVVASGRLDLDVLTTCMDSRPIDDGDHDLQA